MDTPARILVVDDEKEHADAAAEALRRVGYSVDAEYSSKAALERVRDDAYEVIVTDLRFDGPDGIAVLREARARRPETQVILLTGYGTVESAVEAMQAGALTVLSKGAGINLAELRTTVARAVERARLAGKSRAVRAAGAGLDAIIGQSAPLRRILRLVRAVAPTTATVLVIGESGTGKELVAQAVHQNSTRAARPFVTLNCAALSEGILESELFGHEKGSFTGALAARKGRFEYADGGTLFLDEVADMPLSTQVKLLRVLEYGEIFRVGSNQPIRVDVRLVAATNRELEREVAEGRFREDLYFRLKVVTLYLPPLRERVEDIPLLLDAFVAELAALHGRKITEVTPAARQLLYRYHWPGNVRELRNCLESMIVISDDPVLDEDDLPDYVLGKSQAAFAPSQDHPGPVSLPALTGMTLRDVERELIRSTLEKTGGNRDQAARILGIGERTLYRKISEYGLR
jgi:two-component system response regulator HydG